MTEPYLDPLANRMAKELTDTLNILYSRMRPHLPGPYHPVEELQRLLARALVSDQVCALILLHTRANAVQRIEPQGEETQANAKETR